MTHTIACHVFLWSGVDVPGTGVLGVFRAFLVYTEVFIVFRLKLTLRESWVIFFALFLRTMKPIGLFFASGGAFSGILRRRPRRALYGRLERGPLGSGGFFG